MSNVGGSGDGGARDQRRVQAVNEGDQYEPIPRGGSNQSILSNRSQEARESVRRQRIAIGSVALVGVLCVGGVIMFLPNLAGNVTRVSHHGERDDHRSIRRGVENSRDEKKVLATINTTTSTFTTTTRTTVTQTSTTTTSTMRNPKLFCFSIMREQENEISLMREQLSRGTGIYGCDKWAVYSDYKIWLSPGPPTRLDTTRIAANLSLMGDGIKTKYKNAGQFLRAWDQLRQDGDYKSADWIVKADPDTVFFPHRLRALFKNKTELASEPKFFANCQTAEHPHFMFGALEVFSVKAADLYFKHSLRCQRELQSDQMWEERYMSRCLRLLGVKMETEFRLLQDAHCTIGKSASPCTGDSVSFHPLRSPSAYFACRGQAMRSWSDSHPEEKDGHLEESRRSFQEEAQRVTDEVDETAKTETDGRQTMPEHKNVSSSELQSGKANKSRKMVSGNQTNNQKVKVPETSNDQAKGELHAPLESDDTDSEETEDSDRNDGLEVPVNPPERHPVREESDNSKSKFELETLEDVVSTEVRTDVEKRSEAKEQREKKVSFPGRLRSKVPIAKEDTKGDERMDELEHGSDHLDGMEHEFVKVLTENEPKFIKPGDAPENI